MKMSWFVFLMFCVAIGIALNVAYLTKENRERIRNDWQIFIWLVILTCGAIAVMTLIFWFVINYFIYCLYGFLIFCVTVFIQAIYDVQKFKHEQRKKGN
jgi:hypothetical protein